MANLRFFWGPMGAGKSTLALQTEHNYRAAGRTGVVLSCLDRAGDGLVSSRLGMVREALEVRPEDDLAAILSDLVPDGGFVIADEAQFYTPDQVDQLADLVDQRNVDVACFGLLTDFRSTMFPGSQRLMELADSYHKLQLDVLCWCGSGGQQNARVVGDQVVHDGQQVMVGDTGAAGAVRYTVLCRRHWRARQLG